jgi:general secretion pathway protein E
MTADGPSAGLLPYGFVRRHGVVLVAGPHGPRLAARHTPELHVLAEAQRLAGPLGPIQRVDEATFQQLLQDAYQDAAGEAAAAAARADHDLASLADTAASVDDLLDASSDSPVVQLINALLLQAVKEGASDVHIETMDRDVSVRFRIDGMLRDVLRTRRELGPLLVSRIKVMARLDIAEKRLPQDGRISLTVGGRDVDLRISTIPARHAERVVLRLLDRGGVRRDLDSLGLSDRDKSAFQRLLARPSGMLLVTGPTGSGKTTTLYAALSRLHDGARNVMTIEDPIEYAIEGVAQVQVDQRTGLTFARGLRALLRQDPNILMVGEIRDSETAQIAVQASLTGHFVLSTLHTNSAIGSVARMVDMGVERFLLAPILAGVVAQRLVRRLCPNCARPSRATEADVARLRGAIAIGDTVFHPQGCSECRNSGYAGRTAVYEVVEIDRTLEGLIHAGAAEAELTAAARLRGPSLLDDVLDRVRTGQTTVAEAARVAIED